MFINYGSWLFCILLIFVTKSMCCNYEIYWENFTYTGPVTFNYISMIPSSSVFLCIAACWPLYNCDQIYFQGGNCYCLAPVYAEADKVSGTVTTNREFWTTYHDVTSCSEKGYTPFLDQRYCLKYFSTAETWYNAESTCRQDGGHLASVYTQQDVTNLKSTSPNDVKYYIGAHRTLDGTKFGWITGGTVDKSLWQSGEPNNAGGNQDCVGCMPKGVFVDLTCKPNKNTFICQMLIKR